MSCYYIFIMNTNYHYNWMVLIGQGCGATSNKVVSITGLIDRGESGD